MHAIISDIHGNLEALEAVTAAIGDIDTICLGDVVLYGPDSAECVRRSAEWKAVVAGPVDLAMVRHVPEQWGPHINQLIKKFRERLIACPDSSELMALMASYLPSFELDGQRFFHGTSDDVRGYIFPEAIYCPQSIEPIAQTKDYVHIAGGSHIPGIFHRDGDHDWRFIAPEVGVTYELPQDQKTVLTIGSVGQPRDGDWRAAYAIIDRSSVVFHRVEYDIDLTRTKIIGDPDIDDTHGGRLPEGR